MSRQRRTEGQPDLMLFEDPSAVVLPMRRKSPIGRKRCPVGVCGAYVVPSCSRSYCPGKGQWPPLAEGRPA